MRVPVILQRALTTLVAAFPLLAGTDPCTVGALTGRVSMVCVVRTEAAMMCHAQVASPLACPHCAPATPAHAAPRPTGETCCDLKPLASWPAEQPSLTAPVAPPHPALAALPALPQTASAWLGHRAPVVDGSPSGEPPPPLSARAPPLT